MRAYFNYYAEFQEDNLDRLLEAGGLAYAYGYAKVRGEKYGFEPTLSAWSKFTIIRSAIRAEDYGHFKTFCDAFVDAQFVSELRNRALDIGAFYEKNGDHNQAIEIYEVLLQEFSKSKNLLNRIADAHLVLGNTSESEKFRRLAKEISDK